MTVAVGVLFQIVLMIFLSRVEVHQRADLHLELSAPAALNLRDALHRFLGLVVCVVNAGLVLGAHIVALPVFHGGIDHIEVGQQQCVQAYLLRVIFHPNRFPESCFAGGYGGVVGFGFAGAVGVAALGINHAGNGLHQLFDAPEAASGQINHIFRGFHVHNLLFRFALRRTGFAACGLHGGVLRAATAA